MAKKRQAVVVAAAWGAGAVGAALLAGAARGGGPGDIGTTLTIGTDPNPSDPGVPVMISGRLTRGDTGLGVDGATIIIESARSQTAILWSTAALAPTNPDGTYVTSWTPPSGLTYVRARFAGGPA